MMTMHAHRLGALGIAIAVLVTVVPLGAQSNQPRERLAGRPVTEALESLQKRGLRIVYSSAVVTAEMRVNEEPRGATPRAVLDEILAAHGLTIHEGPDRILQIVRGTPRNGPGTHARPKVEARRAEEIRKQEEPHEMALPSAYTERVDVTGRERSIGALEGRTLLDSEALTQLTAMPAGDPIRALHALPAVAANDDFRSEFSMRGSPYRHTGIVVDGVATSWLQHAVYGTGDTASLAMLNSDLIDRVSLQVGAYPRRHMDVLGPQVEFTVREGSRVARSFRASVAGAAGALVAEGPIASSARGSWLVAIRQSLLDWPTRSLSREVGGLALGYRDVQAKVVYDVAPSQQLSLTAIGGRSVADEGNDRSFALDAGGHRAVLVNLGLRSSIGEQSVLTQRAYVTSHTFENRSVAGNLWNRGAGTEQGYIGTFTHVGPHGVVEAGGQASQQQGSALQDTTSWYRAGFAHLRWAVTPTFSLAPGMRIASSSLMRPVAASRWIQGTWSVSPRWAVAASAGVAHQFPDIEFARAAYERGFAPERARFMDVSVQGRLLPSLRAQATLFHRAERNILREDMGLVTEDRGIRLDDARTLGHVDGSSRGLELTLEREAAQGLSGWVAYTYGKSDAMDRSASERYPADFDQRHSLNTWAAYRFGDTALAVSFRQGTNFPIAGYWALRDNRLVAGERRNTVRHPAYARLDVRASRSFTVAGSRMTVFAEVINVLGRQNFGPANGYIDPTTGEAVGFREKLLPRLPLVGLVVQF